MTFENKVAIVTGGASGIGLAIATTLASKGAKVVVADFNIDQAAKVAAELGGASIKVDVGNPADSKAMVEFAIKTYGRLDHAVNNAGISGPMGDLADMDIDGYRRLIAVNQDSVFYAMKYEIPEILKTKGSIVNTSSILGLVAEAQYLPYTAAKHAVAGMTKAAAALYAPQGIRINSVHPGYITTPLLDGVDDQVMSKTISLHPMGRLGTAQEVANVMAFLLSDEASFVTGSQYVVDGAYTAV
ncbi:MAG: SDR family oxidoreductase [Propionibacteriaceae bacterium]|nr:SDR family oxidoreductase [Propionibacteriaceae bacterium]